MTPTDPSQAADNPRTTALFAVTLAALIATTLAVYAPGLHGPFLLDDLPHFYELKRTLFLPLGERLQLFVFSNTSGPLGRPLSMASYLINDYAWPTNPFQFKATNLAIHLITGLLILWLLLLIQPLSHTRTKRYLLLWPVAAAALWLLHPLQTSTVLYVIQRMTQLASLFMLLGLVLYAKGRLRAADSPRSGYFLMSSGLIVGTGFGILAKETAALLPVYVLVTEYTLIRARGTPLPPYWRWWLSIFLLLPITAVLGWHVLNFEGLLHGYLSRPFSMPERLLSEPRILFAYLGYALFPRRMGTGVFHDDFVLSAGVFSPPTTILAIVGWAGLLISAILLRRRQPVYSFAVLWFLGGHLLEAGPIPLEPYFEHRNYLPILGPLTLVVYAFLSLPGKLSRLGGGALLVYCLLTTFATYQNVTLWSDIRLLAMTWAEEHPLSTRAQMFLANQWALAGRHDEAGNVLNTLIVHNPLVTGAPVALVYLTCRAGGDAEKLDWPRILSALRHGRRDTAASETIDLLRKAKEKGQCASLSIGRLIQMIDAALSNPSFRSRRSALGYLFYIRAMLNQSQGQYARSIEWLERAFEADPSTDLALKRAQAHAGLGQYDLALKAIQDGRKIDRHPISGAPLRSEQLDRWEETIRNDREQSIRVKADER